MKTEIGIGEKLRQEAAHVLSRLLADEVVIQMKTKSAHWNIEGIDFYEKHVFFANQASEIETVIDSVAERIRHLGKFVPGTLQALMELTHFHEKTPEKNDSQSFMTELLNDHQSLIIKLRGIIIRSNSEFLDQGTADFITMLMQKHEKMAWMLRAHLNN
jgi:starvation-inducible DNA-binding protein